MQLSRDQASSVRSPSYVETSASVDSTRNCIRWDTGPGPWHPLYGHFLMLLRLAELFGLVLKISCLVSPRKKVRVCSFLGSQCSHLSASNCSLPISIHIEGHSSYTSYQLLRPAPKCSTHPGEKLSVMLKSTTRCADFSTTDDTTFLSC